jgi:hypothetical protein
MDPVVPTTKEEGDFPSSAIAAQLPLECNVQMEVLAANVQSAIDKGYALIQPAVPHPQPCLIVGGGPSGEDLIEEIRAHKNAGNHVFCINGSALWLQRNGIVPDALILLDARAHNARFLDGLHKSVTLFLATQCDPSVFEAGKDNKIIAWHPPLGVDFNDPRGTVMIGGSTTTGMRAMRLVHVLGYRELHLYGYDSSYRDGDAHSYDQFENAGDVIREVICGGRAFVSTAWMIRQADDFQHIAHGLALEGMNIHIHGDGLIPEVARQMNLLAQAEAA